MREVDLLSGVMEALAALPGVVLHTRNTKPANDCPSIDGVVGADVHGQAVRFVITCSDRGDPRSLQHALQRLQAYCHACTDTVVPLIAAPSISGAGRELLRSHHAGYWDSGGSLFLELPRALYFIDRPVPPAAARALRNLYRGSAARVVHALLSGAEKERAQEPGQTWHINDLAERAGVSVSTAHQVCTLLEDQLWLKKEGKGPRAMRTLSEPGALLDAWASSHSLASYSPRRFHSWAQNAAALRETVTAALDAAGIDYALTLSSGAELVAPYSTGSEQLWVLMPAEQANRLAELAQAANLRAVDDGESVTMLLTRERSPLLFRQEAAGAWVASDVQLYLDLSAWPRRGKEQAQHLRTERLQY